MNITEAAIKNNRVTGVVLLVLLVGGIGAYRSLPRAEDPGFIIRTALVLTYLPGASPERVEQLVTDKLEKVIQEMPELDFVSSQSRTGVSYIYVNIQPRYTDMRPIWDSLRRKVEKARDDLPEGVIGPRVNDEFGDVFPIMLTVTGDGYTYAELKKVADAVREELLRLEDVAKVEIYGAQEERLFVEYNNARLAEVGLSPYQLKGILERQNIINPGGSVTAGTERIVLEPSGNFESVDEVRRTIIQLPGRPDVVYLGDLADVHRGYVDPPTAKMHATGLPCLGLSISMRKGGNVIDMGEQVRAVLARLNAVYPIGIDFDLAIFQPALVDQKVSDFVGNLLQAIGIVLAVMLVSLGPRTGVIVATLIPMTMLTSLLLMSVLGIGLDQISIAALIIALGMLVDNAIVMSESIMVQIAQGKNRFRAAVDSANELRVPLLTSSLTTAAAFLPIFLAESSTGEYTASLFKVVTISLLCSWGLSLTMMPLLCMLFIKVKAAPGRGSFGSKFYRSYRGSLIGILRRPWRSLLVVVAVFALALFGMRYVPAVFFPGSDTPRLIGELDLPVRTTIERTEQVVDDIERFLAGMTVGDVQRPRVPAGSDGAESPMQNASTTANPSEPPAGSELESEVASGQGFLRWSTYIGANGGPRYRLSYNPTRAGSEHVSLIISATSRDFINRAVPRIEEYCADRYPELVSSWYPESLGPPVESPVQVRLSSKNPTQLFSLVDQVKAKLVGYRGTKNVQDDWGARTKKLQVEVNQARARRAGVTSLDVAVSLQSGLSGIQTTEFREGDKLIPITLRSVAADRQDIGKLDGLNVYAQSTGRSVPLKQIADVRVVWEASKVLRRDRSKTVTVKCDLEPGVTATEITADLIPWLKEQSRDWPLGTFFEMGGEIESSVEANRSIGQKLPIAFFIIIILLISQFNSVRKTAIILLTIPLGLIGVTIGLLVTGAPFGFMTLLGVISLAGIVINNAIVLIDRIRIEMDENGLEPPRAVVESAQKRLRPILLTTATTIGGLLPLWFGGGPMWQPMAIAIIFGLAFATTLTLGVVPVLYSVFFRVRFRGFEY